MQQYAQVFPVVTYEPWECRLLPPGVMGPMGLGVWAPRVHHRARDGDWLQIVGLEGLGGTGPVSDPPANRWCNSGSKGRYQSDTCHLSC